MHRHNLYIYLYRLNPFFQKDLTPEEREQKELEEALRLSMLETTMSTAATVDSEELDCSKDLELALKLSEDPDISSDFDMALRMQREFDREYEIQEQFEESKKKGGVATGMIQFLLLSKTLHFC